MTTTILVLSVDEAPLLASCLPAALAQPAARVVVIDNACADGTVSLCEQLGVPVVRLRERVSYAAAVNAGIQQTDGDAVLLLNADCVLASGFLEAALVRLARPGVGSVAPKLIRATGPSAAQRLDVLDTAGMVVDRRRKNSLVGHGAPASSHSRSCAVFGGDGACVLYRREVLSACADGNEVLDEDMQLWASDVDLAWRAQRLGWGCVYEPAAVAWHQRFYSPSTRADVPEHHRRLQFRNRYLMMLKNDTAGALLRDLPWVLGYELLALGHVLLRERHLLRGYAEAVRLARCALRRRRALQGRRARRAPGHRVPFGLRAQP